jgi:hypothetical protein
MKKAEAGCLGSCPQMQVRVFWSVGKFRLVLGVASGVLICQQICCRDVGKMLAKDDDSDSAPRGI